MASVLLLVLLGLLLYILFFSYRRFIVFQKRYADPDLTLLLIVRNQAPIIEGVIKELLAYYNTSPKSFELVIFDDASTDETPEILRCLSRRYNCTLVFGQTPVGIKAMEKTLSICRGKVIHFFLLTERVGLRTVSSLARCLSRGEKIPNFGIACASGVMSGTTSN
ncbi:MAG: glycosyltransferase [Thermacetogeniaceae bacterium]|jgi:glycosyltransferase involved in cell wall biosynthesis|nr:glycosyltransferase family 2 protein [Syntrophomonadaceae bacterium]